MKKSRILRILLALTLAAALLLTACSSGGGEEAGTEDPGTELTAEQAGFMLDGLKPDGTAAFPAA